MVEVQHRKNGNLVNKLKEQSRELDGIKMHLKEDSRLEDEILGLINKIHEKEGVLTEKLQIIENSRLEERINNLHYRVLDVKSSRNGTNGQKSGNKNFGFFNIKR